MSEPLYKDFYTRSASFDLEKVKEYMQVADVNEFAQKKILKYIYSLIDNERKAATAPERPTTPIQGEKE